MSTPINAHGLCISMMKNSKIRYLRYVITLILCSMFLYSVIENIIKYKEGKTVVAESTMSASDVVYPSITICPRYKYEYALTTTSRTKNLTEYYQSIVDMSLIRKDIVEISQPYKIKKR